MIKKNAVERILSINGVATSAPDVEIKEMLLSAKWNEDDVETALIVLRENTENHEQRVDSIENVFQNDGPLHPDTISSMLGVDVDAPLPAKARRPYRASSFFDISLIVVVAILLAGCTLGFIAWRSGVALF